MNYQGITSKESKKDFILAPPVTEALLEKIKQIIVDAFAPEKIILFGSYAYGTPTPDSDLDLLVIMDSDESAARQAMKISRLLEPRLIPLDIVVKKAKEIEERRHWVDPFMHEATEKGRVLYARS